MPKYLGKDYPYTYSEMMKEEKKVGRKEKKMLKPLMAAARKGKKTGMSALRRLKKY
tara:strand:- start:1044 stop:1211 length:168 start_codon:yes stop_codon:yes gene_type:complete